MSEARATILGHIRATRTRRYAEYPRTDVPLPPIAQDLSAQFSACAQRLSSDVIGPVAITQITGEVARYLRERGLPREAVGWRAIAGLDWGAHGLTVASRSARGDDMVGITGAFCAIAETGTLMLLSGPETPASVSLLPETHVALLPVTRIVRRMEDAWALLRQEYKELPRAVNFVSGPSRTADIEQTVTLGAHGPYRVCIILTTG